ncbi:hypothetical protein GALL_546870 [mine drainage metagenome]|uniref:Uncharacterized protein n=1 Tax=mine drainage metagenome TaxID=410659 RepID=A0A1J5PEV0_9ZZZZ
MNEFGPRLLVADEILAINADTHQGVDAVKNTVNHRNGFLMRRLQFHVLKLVHQPELGAHQNDQQETLDEQLQLEL